MHQFVSTIIKKLICALDGIRASFRDDLSFRIGVVAGFFFFGFGYVFWPLTELHTALLTLGWFLILITELQNTSIETALDRLHPSEHSEIKKSKDIAAGAVLLAYMFAGGVLMYVLMSTGS